MIKNIINIIAFSCAALLMASCAQEIEESADEIQAKILKAYIAEHYPDAKPSASGLYVVDSIPGTGTEISEGTYVKVDFTITYLDGTYSGYTSESIAKQLGEYTPSGYYRPEIWSVDDLTPGVQELVLQMKSGGYIKAIVPAVLLDEESGDQIYDSEGSTKIYEITAHEVIPDIKKHQIAELEKYSDSHDQLDSLSYGFYFKKLSDNPIDTIKDQGHVYVRYIGRYMDGRVFDTNVPDTAKKYRIYDSANKYETLDFQYYKDKDEALTENSLVKGFSSALWEMNYGEHAYTYFYYELGYGSNGSGKIPGYTPLYFEIWTQKEKNE